MNGARAPYMAMREKKEQAGKLSWSLCLYGTQSMADEAGLTLEEYWEQIIEACYLRDDNPVQKWRQVQAEIETIKDKLDHCPLKNFLSKAMQLILPYRSGITANG
jgi:aminopeptidase